MHLFKRIRYDISGQEIENLVHPGQATTMLGLLKYPDDFSNCGIRIQQKMQMMITLVICIEDITSLEIPIKKDHLVLKFR